MRRMFLIAMWAWSISSYAQDAVNTPASLGLQIRSNGWGASATVPLDKSTHGQVALQLGVHSVHHSREMKVYSTNLPSPGPFHLGKANRLIQGDVSASWQYRLSDASPQSYGLAFGLEAGAAIAALRPVYVYFLELDQRDYYIQTLRRYTEEVHAQHDQVHGDAGWSRGFGEMSFDAGIHTAIYTELSRDNDLHLILDRNNQWFTAIHLAYEIGASKGQNRW